MNFGGLLRGAANIATGGASEAVIGAISDKSHGFSLEANQDKHNQGIEQRTQAAKHKFENTMIDTGLDNMTTSGEIVEDSSSAMNDSTHSFVTEQYG